MRDGNRLKEKIELRLDRRQVVSFVMVALVLVAAIFALGVLVGKNLATLPGKPAAAPEALLDRLDERARTAADAAAPSPDRGKAGGDGLTFQEELTKPAPHERPAPEKRAVRSPPPKPAEAGTGALAAVTDAVDGKGRDAGTGAAPAVPKPGSPKPTQAESAAASFFTVQVKATQSKADAARFSAKLQGEGFHPFVAEVELPGKGRWYRVRVGKFESRAKADVYLADFERETHLAAFVTAAGH